MPSRKRRQASHRDNGGRCGICQPLLRKPLGTEIEMAWGRGQLLRTLETHSLAARQFARDFQGEVKAGVAAQCCNQKWRVCRKETHRRTIVSLSTLPQPMPTPTLRRRAPPPNLSKRCTAADGQSHPKQPRLGMTASDQGQMLGRHSINTGRNTLQHAVQCDTGQARDGRGTNTMPGNPSSGPGMPVNSFPSGAASS